MGALSGVTVVIPAFNAEHYIERSVRSALGQTYPELEVLVVDDGSTDGTLEICRRLQRGHANLRVETGPNGGVAKARNRGTELATSHYVAYLDADDLWHPAKIERQVASLAAHGNDASWAACYALFRLIGPGEEVLGDGLPGGPRGDFFRQHLLENHVGNGSSLLVRRDVALELGGFDASYLARGIGGCEDYDFQLKLLRRYKMEVVTEYLVGYRVHPDQMSNNLSRMGRGQLAVVEKFLPDSGLGPAERKAVRMAAHSAAALAFLRGRDWANLARSARAILSIDPIGGLSKAASFVDQTVRNRLTRGEPRPRPAKFGALRPTDGLRAGLQVNPLPIQP